MLVVVSHELPWHCVSIIVSKMYYYEQRGSADKQRGIKAGIHMFFILY